MTHVSNMCSKVKSQGHEGVNAMTENQSSIQNGKTYEHQTWYADGVRRPTSRTWAVTSQLKSHKS